MNSRSESIFSRCARSHLPDDLRASRSDFCTDWNRCFQSVSYKISGASIGLSAARPHQLNANYSSRQSRTGRRYRLFTSAFPSVEVVTIRLDRELEPATRSPSGPRRPNTGLKYFRRSGIYISYTLPRPGGNFLRRHAQANF